VVILTTVVGSSGGEALPRHRYRRLWSAESGWIRLVPGHVVPSGSAPHESGVTSRHGSPPSRGSDCGEPPDAPPEGLI